VGRGGGGLGGRLPDVLKWRFNCGAANGLYAKKLSRSCGGLSWLFCWEKESPIWSEEGSWLHIRRADNMNKFEFGKRSDRKE